MQQNRHFVIAHAITTLTHYLHFVYRIYAKACKTVANLLS